MSQDLFIRPGVVDAVDKYGRPLEVPYPDARAFSDGRPDATTPACHGDCGQGDQPCPHPGLCTDDDDPLAVFVGLRNAVVLTLAGVAVGSIAALVWTAVFG